MGEVEQHRKSMQGETTTSKEFIPDDSVEKSLIHDVEVAVRNLANYLARCRESQE